MLGKMSSDDDNHTLPPMGASKPDHAAGIAAFEADRRVIPIAEQGGVVMTQAQ